MTDARFPNDESTEFPFHPLLLQKPPAWAPLHVAAAYSGNSNPCRPNERNALRA